MKTIFRILVILAVAAIIGGAIFFAVDALGSSSQPFDGDRRRPPQGEEFRSEGSGEFEGGVMLPFGAVKSLVIMSVAAGAYTLITKAWRKDR